MQNYAKFNAKFGFDPLTNKALYYLSKGKTKRFAMNKKFGHFKATAIIHSLLENKILKLEKSKEQKPNLAKNQKLKKHLRKYQIQDKLIFTNAFTRFFFRFLKPNERLILQGEFEAVLRLIEKEFEHYQSLFFEDLAREFLEKKLQIGGISSFWNKSLELDLYYKDEKICLIGEVKFKNKRVCKSLYTLLLEKARMLSLKPNFYVIFSKNGFSKELESEKASNLLLFELKDFEILRE